MSYIVLIRLEGGEAVQAGGFASAQEAARWADEHYPVWESMEIRQEEDAHA